ncbi:hypothetical protein IP88_12220 [alpha proteobacterium AAP81b]|nr:hypothetical protein IP88_12220 [alpha proteobacterium AAP81b]
MRCLAILLALAGATLPMTTSAQVAAPAAATAADPAAAAFIERLSSDGFAVLRDQSLGRDAARAKFRTMLQQNVALADIGNRLIRRQRASITPAQYAAYQAALPEFILNAYASRLYAYADARVTIVRSVPRGGYVDVVTRVTRPGGAPIDAIWQVRKAASGWQLHGLSVGGVNLSLTQEADFAAYIQKNGFDALVDFMKTANSRSARTPA